MQSLKPDLENARRKGWCQKLHMLPSQALQAVKETASARQCRSLWLTMSRCLQETPLNRSFMHLHLGFDATGLEDLELHHIIVNSWEGGVDTEQACACPAEPVLDSHCQHSA